MRFSWHSRRGRATLVLIATGLAMPAMSGPEHRLVAEGNEAFERQEFDAAAALYQQALDQVPSFSEAAYNRACALVALEQFDLVPDLLRTADLHAPSDDARGRARYNLGAAFYRAGQAITAEDPKEAINRFRAAAAGFKAAVRVNPQDDEARKALELSRRAIKLIEDQLAMPQNLRDLANEQRQQGDQGEGQQQGEQQGQQGEGEQQQPQQGEGQQGQQGQQGQSPRGKGRDRAQRMRETIEQAREQGVQTDPENQPGAEQDIREAEEAMQGGSPEDAARELEEAAEKLERNQQQQQRNQQQQGDQQQQGEEGDGGDQAEDGPESESPVDHVIKQLLEKEREERERRMQYLNPRRPVKARVDKDW